MKEKKTLEKLGRMMPQAVNAERAVIGACLIEQDAFSRISELLRPGSFYDTKHQIIFGAIKHLNDAGEPVDCLTVTDRLQKNGELGKAGGASYVGELATSMLSSAHIELHARIVAEKAQRRHIIEHARDITNEAFDEACDVGEILTRSQDELARISGYSAQRYSTLDEVLDEVERIVETNAKSDTLITGMKTGFGYLDERGAAAWEPDCCGRGIICRKDKLLPCHCRERLAEGRENRLLQHGNDKNSTCVPAAFTFFWTTGEQDSDGKAVGGRSQKARNSQKGALRPAPSLRRQIIQHL